MSSLVDRIGYEVGKVLHRNLGRFLRAYEGKSEPLAEAKLERLVKGVTRPPGHDVADEPKGAEIVPLHQSDLDEEIAEMRADWDKIHGWMLIRFYSDGSYGITPFGCLHADMLALAGALLTDEALDKCRSVRDEPEDGA